jgi:hypothetical protein
MPMQGAGPNSLTGLAGMPPMPGAPGVNNDQLMMQMAMLQQNSLMGMTGMPVMPQLGCMNQIMGIPGMLPNVMSSAAQFHQPAEKNQIKLFVGGLAFSTTENELLTYFQDYGKVENTIVMRDKATGRGRGFGFVLVSFTDEQAAVDAKHRILQVNRQPGHFILEKRVDVKSADDY